MRSRMESSTLWMRRTSREIFNLTLQLLEMHIPMVLALNMMDEVRGNGGSIDYRQMSQELGIPVIPISAAKDEGIEDLIAAIVEVAGKKIPPKVMDFCEQGPVHRCIHAVSHQVEIMR